MQRVGAAALPGGMPAAHGLAGNAESTGDLGLAYTDGEQLASAQPAGLQAFTFMLRRRAARDSWHAPDPHPPTSPTPTSPTAVKPTPKTL
jgi:hypothetical protein